MKHPLSKFLAVCLISSEIESKRRTRAGLRTLRECAGFLGFSIEELRKLETACEYRSEKTGELYTNWE
jgi:hypothetical protein